MTCDYHDLPLVCGACGLAEERGPHGFVTTEDGTFIQKIGHGFLPVHKREDPEGMEPTQLIPCSAVR